MKIHLDDDVPVPKVTEWLDLPRAVRDREALDPIGIFPGDRVRNPDNERKLRVEF